MTLSSSPAPSSDQVPDEDRVSQSSNDSRRQSEAVQIDGIPQGKDHKPYFFQIIIKGAETNLYTFRYSAII